MKLAVRLNKRYKFKLRKFLHGLVQNILVQDGFYQKQLNSLCDISWGILTSLIKSNNKIH